MKQNEKPEVKNVSIFHQHTLDELLILFASITYDVHHYKKWKTTRV